MSLRSCLCMNRLENDLFYPRSLQLRINRRRTVGFNRQRKLGLPWRGDPEGLLDRPGTGLQRPPCLDVSSCSISSSPALFWKRLIRFTTRGDICVRTQGWPP